jgi:TATA-box binding protein (TBP) (component of TFIID and TFIIIB)
MNIEEEWENFMTAGGDSDEECDETYFYDKECEIIKNKINEEIVSTNISADFALDTPKASNLYISTKTKIAYLNTEIDLKEIFWNIGVIPYATPSTGVIKKQMKFNSTTQEELKFIEEQLKKEKYFEEYVITHINNPEGRIKFKDIRKISIGISKKDILSYRCKKKSAFYNCFVIIIRMKTQQGFKEFHVKVFNTGKLEIPGVQNEEYFDMVLKQILEILQPHINTPLNYKENTIETVLINSNFNCGFFINREALYELLKFKYNLQTIYDPCSYPGIQCKFYYNHDIGIQSGCQISEENKHLYKNINDVSFMIFRTGSVLIVGKCDENVLISIYEFLKNILMTEYKNICQHIKSCESNGPVIKDKNKKIRKKNITIEISSV